MGCASLGSKLADVRRWEARVSAYIGFGHEAVDRQNNDMLGQGNAGLRQQRCGAHSYCGTAENAGNPASEKLAHRCSVNERPFYISRKDDDTNAARHNGRVHRTTFLLFTVLGTVAAETISDGDRAYLLSHLEMTREFVVDTTRGLSKEQWLYQPGPARWSIAQCIDHLAQTEEYLLKVVRERIIPSKEPLVGTFPSMTKGRQHVADQPKRMSRVEDSFILRWMTDRTPSATTPVEQRPPIEEVAPRRVIDDPQSALEHFRRARAATIAYVRMTQDDLRGHFSQSPMAGFPDCSNLLCTDASVPKLGMTCCRKQRNPSGRCACSPDVCLTLNAVAWKNPRRHLQDHSDRGDAATADAT